MHEVSLGLLFREFEKPTTASEPSTAAITSTHPTASKVKTQINVGGTRGTGGFGCLGKLGGLDLWKLEVEDLAEKRRKDTLLPVLVFFAAAAATATATTATTMVMVVIIIVVRRIKQATAALFRIVAAVPVIKEARASKYFAFLGSVSKSIGGGGQNLLCLHIQ